VNTLTDNIFNLRFGYKENLFVANENEKKRQLKEVLARRQKRIRVIDELIKAAVARRDQILVWGVHADIVAHQMKIRVMEQIVRYSQELNIILESHGRPNAITVGIIEKKVGFMPYVGKDGKKGKYGPMDKEYGYRKIVIQVTESQELLDILMGDMATNDRIRKEMVGFISKAFGHNSWETLVEARWLRNKANLKSYKFDPNKS